MMGPLTILHVSPEAVPLAKVGGMADVVGSLPEALNGLGFDARLLMPAWGDILDDLKGQGISITHLPGILEISLGNRLYRGSIHQCHIGSTIVYLLSQADLYGGPIYPEETSEETVRPFAFLSYGALILPSITGWAPEVYHCHDWVTAILPLALNGHPWFRGQKGIRKTMLTIHNLAHQGLLSPSAMGGLQLPEKSFSIDTLEYFGQVNLLKGGIMTTDHITVVSPSYAREIATPEGGHGLDGVLRRCENKLTGILNGLNLKDWDPKTDRALPKPFSVRDLSGKAAAQQQLLKETGLDRGPIAAVVSRLVEQKGMDILLPALGELADQGLRTVIVGSGEPRYENWLAALEREHPGKIRFFKGYHENLARLTYAGADLYLMPSLFEPCGLSQLIALRYGTVPVVRRVGGLADTITDMDEPDGVGFVFERYDRDDLIRTVLRAMKTMEDRKSWESTVRRGMRRDFSWGESAKIYGKIYRDIVRS
ncbi:MAG: glycogen synthase [Dethiosulfovibrio peptidovorans]|nr:MAG: glycogen synthase [Dethiosulfovibrio peptidovorans]